MLWSLSPPPSGADTGLYLMIGKILGFWLVNWHVIWSCINRSESYINLLVFVCMYVCSFLLPVQRSRRQSWDKFVINCFGVWYNLYLAIRRLYHPRLRLGWYSHLIARYKLYHTPKQLITNSIWLVPKLKPLDTSGQGSGGRSRPKGFVALRCILSHSWHLKLFWLNYFSRNLIVFLVFLSHILNHSLLTTDLCNGFHNKRLTCG